MRSATHADHEFVDQIPEELNHHTLYISIPYRMTAHLCMCGCGEKVVHPLRPHRWSLTFDGTTVSLAPSIGNDGLPCRSHYWITESRVIWHPKLTDLQITGARTRDGWQTPGTEHSASTPGGSVLGSLLRGLRRLWPF